MSCQKTLEKRSVKSDLSYVEIGGCGRTLNYKGSFHDIVVDGAIVCVCGWVSADGEGTYRRGSGCEQSRALVHSTAIGCITKAVVVEVDEKLVRVRIDSRQANCKTVSFRNCNLRIGIIPVGIVSYE